MLPTPDDLKQSEIACALGHRDARRYLQLQKKIRIMEGHYTARSMPIKYVQHVSERDELVLDALRAHWQAMNITIPGGTMRKARARVRQQALLDTLTQDEGGSR